MTLMLYAVVHSSNFFSLSVLIPCNDISTTGLAGNVGKR